nr:retrovirus-related Pol polyprotein from transposon TNT 1-94 [Tanacetum cinerariifolium]
MKSFNPNRTLVLLPYGKTAIGSKQPPGFESSEFPDYVYKLDKALYGLKKAPRACSSVKTPMVPPNNLGPDLAGKLVNETSYRGMIGSLMYLTTTRPDIKFSIVLCVRYQSNPKKLHLTYVKRILRYLKGTPTLGLYYIKCLGFDLKGYSDSDYAGCNIHKKSTLGACQILGGKFVCWSAKKQQSVAMSSAEAEYVDADGCCVSILWMKSQLSDYDIHYKMVTIFCDNTSAIAISNNLILHSRTKHIDIRYHFNRDHILKGDIELHFILTEYQLADIFTKPLDELTFTRLKAELNFLGESWSTVVAFDPFPSTNEPKKRPLKEFLIKFLILNGQRPLTLNFNTFCSSTVLDYNNGKYVDHPTPEVLSEQVNSIQQLLAYSLITGTEVDIWEIIYNDLVTKILNNSRRKYISYPRFISCALQVLLSSEYTQDKIFGFLPLILSNSNFTKDLSKVTDIELTAHMIALNNRRDSVSPPLLASKTKKGKSQTVTSTLPKSQGPEALGALSKKSKRPNTRLPFTLDEGTRKSHPLPESTTTHPKDSRGNKQTLDMDITSMTPDEGTAKTTTHPDTEPLQLQTFVDIQAFLIFENELEKESDEEEVLEVKDDMDEDSQDDAKVRTPSPKQTQPKPSHVQESASDSSSPDLNSKLL